MSNWVTYKNGNYTVKLDLSTGTKIRENDLSFFAPEKPESMDIKITNCCDMGCPMCHEDSKPDGKHGDILNVPFIDTLLPYTELAIGGGNPLSHPQIIPFLYQLRDKKLIANMTVNQKHFLENKDFLKSLCDNKLIYGLGVSITSVTDELISSLKEFPNAVLHVINGMITMLELERLSGNDFKVLILGYKNFRRGEKYYEKNNERVDELKNDLDTYLFPEIIHNGWFKVVSFDNLAIKQLHIQEQMPKEQWDKFYMGDDGGFTMYVDMVNGEFAKSSVSTKRYSITDNIVNMFNIVREENHEE